MFDGCDSPSVGPTLFCMSFGTNCVLHHANRFHSLSSGPCGSRQVYPDGLHLSILLMRFNTLVAATKAGLFEAAEWRRYIALGVAVDRYCAGIDPPRKLVSLPRVRGVKRRRQAIFGIVGQLDRVVVVPRFGYGQHRAKDLFAVDGHIGRDTVEHRRLDEVAWPIQLVATAGECRALRAPPLEILLDVVAVVCAHDWAELGGRLQRIAQFPVPTGSDDLLDQFFLDRTVHDQA